MLKSKIGYSTKVNSFSSGKETATKAMKKLTAPKVGMLYVSSVYDEEVLKGVKSVLEDVPIIGCTTKSPILVPDGIIDNEKGFSGMMIMDDEDMIVSVAGSEGGQNPREIGQMIALEAIKGSHLKIRPSYFYMIASSQEEAYLNGIEDVIGRVPLFGGSVEENCKIFCNNSVIENGCAVAFFYTTKDIVTQLASGYKETSDMGIVTSVINGRNLAEIDHKPALQKYANWKNLDLEKFKKESFPSITTLSPFGVKDPFSGNIVIHQLKSSLDGNAITLGRNIEEGTAVIRMEATVGELIDSIKVEMDNLNDRMEEKVGAYLLVHSSALRESMGKETKKIYTKLKKIAKDVPYLMIFSQSQYGYQEHSANTVGNLMVSFTAFSE